MNDEIPLSMSPSPIRQSKQSTAKLYEALAAAQAEYPAIEKKHTARVYSKDRPRTLLYTFDYADLADIMSQIRPILGKRGLAVLQFPLVKGTTLWIVSRLAFKDGSWIEADYPAASIKDGFNHQSVAGGVTFAKRYSYTAITGVSAESEKEIDGADDGRDFEGDAGEDEAPKKQAPPPRRAPPKEEPAPRRETTPQNTAKTGNTTTRDPLMRSMLDQSTVDSLKLWHENHKDELAAKDQGWQDEFYARYDHRMSELRGEPSLMGG